MKGYLNENGKLQKKDERECTPYAVYCLYVLSDNEIVSEVKSPFFYDHLFLLSGTMDVCNQVKP